MIDPTSKTEMTESTQAILNDIRAEMGMVPNFFQAQADVDPEWLALNWSREKSIMLSDSALDRKTKELIAMTVSLVNRCDYCSLAHETMARMVGVTQDEINDVKKVIELFSSFNSIADSLKIPCDVTPALLNDGE